MHKTGQHPFTKSLAGLFSKCKRIINPQDVVWNFLALDDMVCTVVNKSCLRVKSRKSLAKE